MARAASCIRSPHKTSRNTYSSLDENAGSREHFWQQCDRCPLAIGIPAQFRDSGKSEDDKRWHNVPGVRMTKDVSNQAIDSSSVLQSSSVSQEQTCQAEDVHLNSQAGTYRNNHFGSSKEHDVTYARKVGGAYWGVIRSTGEASVLNAEQTEEPYAR
ncbi:hypothetical protein Bbelb_209590 [Branchiostoma belcheri]|nr:hypothetical protein Bbelb_209590 [Branchiostoma belcheri]